MEYSGNLASYHVCQRSELYQAAVLEDANLRHGGERCLDRLSLDGILPERDVVGQSRGRRTVRYRGNRVREGYHNRDLRRTTI